MKKLMISALLLSGLSLTSCGEVALEAAQFTLDVTPHSVQVVRGGAVTLTAQITRGLNLPVGVPVMVSLQDAPSGVEAGAVSIGAGATSAAIQLKADAGASTGDYTLTFQGSGGVGEQTSSVDLQVR